MTSMISGKVITFKISANSVTIPFVTIRLNHGYKFREDTINEIMSFVELLECTLGDNSLKDETMFIWGELECMFGDTCTLEYHFDSINNDENEKKMEVFTQMVCEMYAEGGVLYVSLDNYNMAYHENQYDVKFPDIREEVKIDPEVVKDKLLLAMAQLNMLITSDIPSSVNPHFYGIITINIHNDDTKMPLLHIRLKNGAKLIKQQIKSLLAVIEEMSDELEEHTQCDMINAQKALVKIFENCGEIEYSFDASSDGEKEDRLYEVDSAISANFANVENYFSVSLSNRDLPAYEIGILQKHEEIDILHALEYLGLLV